VTRALSILLALTLPICAAVADNKSDKPFWLTAYTREARGGAGRTIYFCGRAPFPSSTPINVFLRFKGRIFKATQVRVNQRSTGLSQAKAFLGAGAGGVNFGGSMGPIEGMALGEWELICMVTRNNKRTQTSYSLIVGEVNEIVALEAKEAERLGLKLKKLEAAHARIKARADKFASVKQWDAAAKRRWRTEAVTEDLALRKMSTTALTERSRQLAPLFPFVQTVLTQMPIKIRDLGANYYFLFNETRGGKTKPRFNREEVIKRLEHEIVTNIQRAWAGLNARGRTSQEGLFVDLSKFENLLAELKRQHKRARGTSNFHAGIWNAMVRNGQRGAAFLRRKLARYKSSDFGRKNAETIGLFEKSLVQYNTLAAKWSRALYRRHSVSKQDHLEFDEALLAERIEPKLLVKQLDQSLVAIRQIAARAKLKLGKELAANQATMMEAFLEILDSYLKADPSNAAAFTQIMGRIKAQLGRISDESKSKLTQKHLLYFPSASRGVAAFASGLIGFGDEIDQLLVTKKPKGKMIAHGYPVEYDRKEVIEMRGNSALSVACDIQKELGLTNHSAFKKVIAYFARLKIKLNPLVEKKLADLK